jgi:hypothetical protein
MRVFSRLELAEAVTRQPGAECIINKGFLGKVGRPKTPHDPAFLHVGAPETDSYSNFNA